MTMPTPLIVRPATAADASALGRLGAHLLTVHHDFDPQRFIAPSPETERAYGSFLDGESRRPDRLVLVAEQAGEVVGYAYAGLEGHDWMALRGPAGVVYDLVVDTSRRRGGVGSRLLADCVARLVDRGAPRIVLSTAERNETAQRLFAAAGFRRTMIEMTLEAPAAPR
jgi:ribosomal protein S18 acetylase RimI-like enzyme